jgi:hypothetical protein
MRQPSPAARRRRRRIRFALFAGIFLVSTSGGCRTAQVAGSSVELLAPLPDPSVSAKGHAEVEENVVVNAIDPSLIGDLDRPAYPRDALEARAGECVIFATITIDTNGRVSDVRTSWQRLNIPNRFSDEFLAAVKAAVDKWRFEPARNVYWQKDVSGELRYMRTEIVAARTDVKFTFEASGRVR